MNLQELAGLTAEMIEAMPITAFYWHDDLNCYIIERGDILEFFHLSFTPDGKA